MSATRGSAHRASVGGAVLLIGLGMLLLSGWWWPGILVVIGAAIASDRLLEGNYASAAIVLAIFVGIPVGIALLDKIDIPWTELIAFVLIAMGGVALVRSVMGSRSR